MGEASLDFSTFEYSRRFGIRQGLAGDGEVWASAARPRQRSERPIIVTTDITTAGALIARPPVSAVSAICFVSYTFASARSLMRASRSPISSARCRASASIDRRGYTPFARAHNHRHRLASLTLSAPTAQDWGSRETVTQGERCPPASLG